MSSTSSAHVLDTHHAVIPPMEEQRDRDTDEGTQGEATDDGHDGTGSVGRLGQLRGLDDVAGGGVQRRGLGARELEVADAAT